MMMTKLAGARAARLSDHLREFAAHEPTFFLSGATLWVAMLPTYVVSVFDGRQINGVSVWDKPLKFQFAFGLYLLTLVLFARFVPRTTRETHWYAIFSLSVATGAVAEAVWTVGSAALGTEAHFNPTTIGTAIYAIMGVVAIVVISASGVYAFHIARNRAHTLPPAVAQSIVFGLALTAPLTLVTAGTITDGHWVGGARTDANGLALMGWVRDGGDLRVAHFFATHALHFLPVFGLISSAVCGRDATWPIKLFAAFFVLFTLWTFLQAHSGRPFLPMLQ